MNKEQLTAKIKLSNNGYLFNPSDTAVATAIAHPETFVLTGNKTTGNGKTIRLK